VKGLACLLALVGLVAVARADKAMATPWANGVPKPQQDRANAEFAAANSLFAHDKHEEALVKYRAAIELWDHPMIRFNMAVTLIKLDQLVEAADALQAALRFGAAPFTKELYSQALDYDHLIRGRVGAITVKCTQAGVQIWLDGKKWFACEGSQRVRVLAGQHTLLAEKHGLAPESRQLFVSGGASIEESIELSPADVRLRYRTARWIPWTVAAGGLSIGVAGLATWFSGRNDMDTFQVRHASECASRCDDDLTGHPALRELRDDARFKGDLGASLMVAGGAVVAGGLVWALVINRPERVTPQLEVDPSRGEARATLGWSF